MKKRIFYGLLFTSLMILSTISVFAQPTVGANWKFGVPDAARGMSTESEVKVFDKDEWAPHIGWSPTSYPNRWFGGDQHNADNVGAKSKTSIIDWKNEDIWFLGDHLLHSQIGANDFGLTTYWDGIAFADTTVTATGALIGGCVAGVAGMADFPGNATLLALYNALNTVYNAYLVGTPSIEEFTILYDKTYEGVILEANRRYFDLEYDDDPDEIAANIPFITDPHDIFDSYGYFIGAVGELFGTFNDLSNAALGQMAPWFGLTGAHQAELEGNCAAVGGYLTGLGTASGTLLAILSFFEGEIPDKKEYLNLLLRGGLPAHQPVSSWWGKVVDDFNIDDDAIYGTGTTTMFHKGGIEADGNVVTVDYEWEPSAVWQDTDGTIEEFEDYSITYTYSDTGGQSSVEFTGSEVFYKIESLAPVIPGYEITILLAAAAISAMALIYIVMKKKRM